MELEKLIRKNILNLKPYSSARSEFTGEGSVFLDANENPFDNGFNRYPDPLQIEIKDKIGQLKGVDAISLLLGTGRHKAIDFVFIGFFIPGQDDVMASHHNMSLM